MKVRKEQLISYLQNEELHLIIYLVLSCFVYKVEAHFTKDKQDKYIYRSLISCIHNDGSRNKF